METLQKQLNTATTEVKTFNIELVELKRRHQEYEITRQTLVTKVHWWKKKKEYQKKKKSVIKSNSLAKMFKSIKSTSENKF